MDPKGVIFHHADCPDEVDRDAPRKWYDDPTRTWWEKRTYDMFVVDSPPRLATMKCNRKEKA